MPVYYDKAPQVIRELLDLVRKPDEYCEDRFSAEDWKTHRWIWNGIGFLTFAKSIDPDVTDLPIWRPDNGWIINGKEVVEKFSDLNWRLVCGLYKEDYLPIQRLGYKPLPHLVHEDALVRKVEGILRYCVVPSTPNADFLHAAEQEITNILDGNKPDDISSPSEGWDKLRQRLWSLVQERNHLRQTVASMVDAVAKQNAKSKSVPRALEWSIAALLHED
jgi:hypothetical protein